MDVYKNIKEAKYQIEVLKKKIPFFKNQQQLDYHLKLINTLITMVNTVDALASSQLKTDVIDKLILSMFRNYLIEVYAAEEKIPIHIIVNRINEALTDSLLLKKEQVLNLLEDILLSQILKNLPTVPRRNTCYYDIDYTKIDNNGLNIISNDIVNSTSRDEWSKMVEELLTEFKQNIQWN